MDKESKDVLGDLLNRVITLLDGLIRDEATEPEPDGPLPSDEDLALLEDYFYGIAYDLKDLLLERHAKYGSGNIAEDGLPGIVVRLGDKVARLKTLQRGAGEAVDESIEDTLMDVANYAIIALMYRNGSWPGSVDKS